MKISFITLCALLAVLQRAVVAQNCGCAPDLCCSKYGYCGLGDPYCGEGCQSGPCYGSSVPSTGGRVSVADVVTDGFFQGILNSAPAGCAGRGFYTRSAFLQAVGSYPQFGAVGSSDVVKREVAAFFAHVTHETGSFCYREEINGASKTYCDSSPQFREYPCVAGKSYHGRGPLQLTWNYNYGAAARSIHFDGLNDPDILARDPILSFKAALWFWMGNCHNAITSGQGFGATTRAINSIECNGGNAATVAARAQYYRNYCSQFGVDPGADLTC